MKLSKIEDFSVAVKKDEKSNQSLGVIYCRDLKYSTTDEIIEELKRQHVVDIKSSKKRGQDGETYDTGLYFVTFDTRQTPNEIKIGYEVVDVCQYIPEPMRCFICLKFGHSKKYCKTPENEKKCGNCANDVHTDREKREKCQESPKCVNCGSKEHGSFARFCNVYKMEKEINALRATKKISYGIAKREFMMKNPLRMRIYATAVRSKP